MGSYERFLCHGVSFEGELLCQYLLSLFQYKSISKVEFLAYIYVTFASISSKQYDELMIDGNLKICELKRPIFSFQG